MFITLGYSKVNLILRHVTSKHRCTQFCCKNVYVAPIWIINFYSLDVFIFVCAFSFISLSSFWTSTAVLWSVTLSHSLTAVWTTCCPCCSWPVSLFGNAVCTGTIYFTSTLTTAKTAHVKVLAFCFWWNWSNIACIWKIHHIS